MSVLITHPLLTLINFLVIILTLLKFKIFYNELLDIVNNKNNIKLFKMSFPLSKLVLSPVLLVIIYTIIGVSKFLLPPKKPTIFFIIFYIMIFSSLFTHFLITNFTLILMALFKNINKEIDELNKAIDENGFKDVSKLINNLTIKYWEFEKYVKKLSKCFGPYVLTTSAALLLYLVISFANIYQIFKYNNEIIYSEIILNTLETICLLARTILLCTHCNEVTSQVCKINDNLLF